jgi:hypothetical protein
MSGPIVLGRRALCRTRTGDPFLTIATRRFSGVWTVSTKSLQTLMVCRLDMTGAYQT